MSTKYQKTFKLEAVKKVLSRELGVPLTAIARSLNVSGPTLHRWVKEMTREAENSRAPSRGGESQKSPYMWTTQERLEAIITAAAFSEDALNEFCRKQGIFPHHLEAWKKEFLESHHKPNSDSSGEIRHLKNEIKKLNADLNRKDRALAEASALLILKKKAQEIWGNNEEN